jgi:hypothetical protein
MLNKCRLSETHNFYEVATAIGTHLAGGAFAGIRKMKSEQFQLSPHDSPLKTGARV